MILIALVLVGVGLVGSYHNVIEESRKARIGTVAYIYSGTVYLRSSRNERDCGSDEFTVNVVVCRSAFGRCRACGMSLGVSL